MILRELFYHSEETMDMTTDQRYSPDNDTISALNRSDTRKTRLTLGQINRVRRASDASNEEKEKDLVVTRQMYSNASTAPEGGF